jgi:ribosomal peptide maturation radical SAM protein 1
VALVNMPFAMADRPSIQCGLLKSALARAGHAVETFYLNLELAAVLGAALYLHLAKLRSDQLLGDWLFSVAAFGPRFDEAPYRTACSLDTTCEELGIEFQRLCELRNSVLPAWIQDWSDRIDWQLYAAVGFTSTFEQNTAGFALARRIKERFPMIAIIFGGANFDGDMAREYVRTMPFIDYAVSGEGDYVLPQIIDHLRRGEIPSNVPGVVHRQSGRVSNSAPATRVHDLDDLPDPDYDEYFATLFRLGRERVIGDAPPLLLFESARGCWWGETQHCTFCGLNATGLAFRSKSPPALAAQLARLANRYDILNFAAVDNIMRWDYTALLCPLLGQNRRDYSIFYEVKANLSSDQLRCMAHAGVTAIQPGIESLSSHILKLMRKGASMLTNVRLLKWAYYYGMRVSWNLLTGFPGELQSDYERQLEVIALLRHLPPPTGCGRIWLERFSPYFFDASSPVSEKAPLAPYGFIYPAAVDINEIAYFFEYRMEGVLPEATHDSLRHAVAAWKAAWEEGPRPVLIYQRAPAWLQIVDRREDAVRVHTFRDTEADIYEICSASARTIDFISSRLLGRAGSCTDSTEITIALKMFSDLGLMLEEDGRYLSLALPANPNW